MKPAIAVAAISLSFLLAGCVARGPVYGPGPYATGPYVAGPYVGAVAFDGYYDGYYGPFYDGYWRRDGFFYYRDRDGHGWHRDNGSHFRRDGANGYRPVHGGGDHGPASRPGGGAPRGGRG